VLLQNFTQWGGFCEQFRSLLRVNALFLIIGAVNIAVNNYQRAIKPLHFENNIYLLSSQRLNQISKNIHNFVHKNITKNSKKP